MKKRVILILCLSLALASSGCVNKGGTTEGSIVKQETDNSEKEETSKKEPTDSSPDKKDDTAIEETPSAPEAQMQRAIVYFVDDQGVVQKKEIEAAELNEQSLWQLLKDDGTVSTDSTVLSMNIDDKNQIQLNVNHAFGEQMRSLGTSGETMLFRCVINSYLDTFSCGKIMVTEEGSTLDSSHKSYEGYYEKKNE